MKILNQIKGFQRKRLVKKIMKHYKWWDHSYLFELMSIWLNESSKKHKTDGILVKSVKVSKEMNIASMYCEYIADSKAWENVYKRYGNTSYNVDLLKKENELNVFYLNQLTRLLKRKSLHWWD